MAMTKIGGDGVFTRTEVAGTKIRVLIQPALSGYTHVTKLVYTTQGTAHTVTFLRPLGRTRAASTAAAAVTSFSLDGDPGPSGNGLAASDLVAIRETDGVTRLYTVSSYAAGTLTLTGGLTVGVASGARVWNFGVEADTDPVIGRAHEYITTTVSSTETFDSDDGILSSHLADSPVLVSSSNGTAAGTIKQLTWAYSAVGDTGTGLLGSSDEAVAL